MENLASSMNDQHPDKNDNALNYESEQTTPNSTQDKVRKRWLSKWLLPLMWLVIFCTAVWYVQSHGPFVVNGVSLSVPISE